MTNNRFRSVAFALRSYISDTYNLLDAADAIVALDSEIEPFRPVIKSPDGRAVYNWSLGHWTFDHNGLVDIALNNSDILEFMLDNKKIHAIKELRGRTFAGLKESKEAIEDGRVTDYVERVRAERAEAAEAIRQQLVGAPWGDYPKECH